MTVNKNQDPACLNIEAQITDYLDNMLPARQMWEVEKHLAGCSACTARLQVMKTTIELLHTTDRFDTSKDFMANLHARLDTLEPEPALVHSGWNHFLDGLAELKDALWSRRAPVLGLSMAGAALVLLTFYNRPQIATGPVLLPTTTGQLTLQPLHRNVALSAGNPFDDPLAANLEAHSALKDTTAAPNTEE